MIADSRGYDDIIEGTETPPDEKEDLEILDNDDVEVKKSKKAKQLTRAANKKGDRDLVMSTDSISLNIVENSTSDKLTKGDLKKAWGRLERCWNPKTREDKVEFYTKFLNYKLENVRQRPMDWLAFLERKRTELVNTGHIIDDETFITHLLNSLPQAEYMGAILAIKEKLRRSSYNLAEIEQLLEDKYQSINYVKGWEEEEDDYALFAGPNNKEGHKKPFKGQCGYCGEFGHKAVNFPNKKSSPKKGSKEKFEKRRHKNLKRTVKKRSIPKSQKLDAIIVVNWVIFLRTARNHVKMLILLKKMSKRKLAEMMDLGNSSVCEECAMICTDIYSDKEYEEMVVYRDQGTSTRKYDEETYGELMNTDSDEEKIVNYDMALCAQDSVSLEKKQRGLNRDIPNEDINNLSQSQNNISGIDHEEVINKEIDTVQGPTSYDKEIELKKMWATGMPTMDFNISTMEADELEQIEDNNKKFLYARAVHANHMILHYMHEILKRQRVVNEDRSMADGERDMIPLESDQYKNDLVINQHIMQMIDANIFGKIRPSGQS